VRAIQQHAVPGRHLGAVGPEEPRPRHGLRPRGPLHDEHGRLVDHAFRSRSPPRRGSVRQHRTGRHDYRRLADTKKGTTPSCQRPRSEDWQKFTGCWNIAFAANGALGAELPCGQEKAVS